MRQFSMSYVCLLIFCWALVSCQPSQTKQNTRFNDALIWKASILPYGYAFSTAFSPDGLLAIAGTRDGTARIWRVDTGKEVMQIKENPQIEQALDSASFSPDGKNILTSSAAGTVRVYDALDGHEVLKLPEKSFWVESAAYSPDGTRIVTANFESMVKVWDAKSGELYLELQDDYGSLHSAQAFIMTEFKKSGLA